MKQMPASDDFLLRWKGDTLEVSLSPALSNGNAPRANDYEVQISTLRRGIERVVATKRVYSRGYMFAEKMDAQPVLCDFDAEALAPILYMPVRFAARPVGAFGTKGTPVSRDFSVAELARLAD